MWPDYIANVIPFRNGITFKETLLQLLPYYSFREGFKKHGITNPEERYALVNLVAILSNDKYIDYPKVPELDLDNADDDICRAEAYWTDRGRYYWFDFDILDRDRHILPLRAVFNRRDADYENPIWGVAWDRNTGTEVVHFSNIGKNTGKIEMISLQHIDSYQPYNPWFLDQFGSSICCSTSEEWTQALEIEAQPSYTIYLARIFELEKLIRFALQWCADYIFDDLSDMVIAYKDLMTMVSKEKFCREQFGNIEENDPDRIALLGNLCLVREYEIESGFENVLGGDSRRKVYFFSKLPEDSFSIDNITHIRWKFLFYFAHDYLSQYYNLEYSLTLEEEDGEYSDEVRASSDKVTRYSASYRHRFESIEGLAIWFEQRFWNIKKEQIHIFLNSISAKLNPSGYPISAYELNDGDRNENYQHTVYAIVATSCLILVVKDWGDL
ncbi:hypothetical protein [Roseofilum sp. Guam]|uniref:hypothetical protein n=1 Tax=Roseofilum sp. Guam TaxID=2821502 RepID=UPI001B1864D2|nr:hypothetical protein [Roseofilum sp. Guam]MBP0029980.1 hypothetical protein [Roseofilum sp. Guam]